jgi:hypothetical protein
MKRVSEGPSYGLAHTSQLNGAVAQVVRDPAAANPELVVYGQENLDPKYYVAAKAILASDKKLVPSFHGRRVISLLPDGKLRLQADGKTMWSIFSARVFQPQAELVTMLLDRLPKAREIHVAGIGAVRLVYDGSPSA